MPNSESGSRSNGTDQDFLAAFLAGEIQRNHLASMPAVSGGFQFPGFAEDAPELEAEILPPESGTTDADPSCSNCCGEPESVIAPCLTSHPVCDTKADCHTHPPQCNTHKGHCDTKPPHCHDDKPAYTPKKHASW